MSKSVPDTIMDAALDAVAGSTRMDVTSDVGTPTDLTNTLANVAMAGGDFVKAVGDAGAGSRKVTMGAKAGVSVTGDGTPLHVVLTLTAVIKLITTCTGPDLTNGSSVDFPAWKYEIGIPT